MTGRTIRLALLAVLIAGGAGAFWWAFKPRPVAVDLAQVTRGAMEVTISWPVT